MTPALLAAEVAELPLDGLASFVHALPRLALLALCSVADDCVWTERYGKIPAPAVVVATPLENAEDILRADEAAALLRISLDTLYARVERGELVPLPRVPGGRLKFRRGDLRRIPPVASGVDQRYPLPHDSPRGTSPADAARVDTTRARSGPECGGDDRRPLGARRARRQPARGGGPWSPGQAAWHGPPKPPKG